MMWPNPDLRLFFWFCVCDFVSVVVKLDCFYVCQHCCKLLWKLSKESVVVACIAVSAWK